MFGRETDRFEVKSVSPQILNQASPVRSGFFLSHSHPQSPFILILFLILILKREQGGIFGNKGTKGTGEQGGFLGTGEQGEQGEQGILNSEFQIAN